MKRFNCAKIRLLLVGFVAAILAGGGGKAYGDFTFGEPVNVGPTVNTSSEDSGPSISADGLSLYFRSTRPGGYGSFDLWVTTRESTDDDWGPAVNLGPTVNAPSFESEGCISSDGLSLYFGSNRAGGRGSWDLWVTTRATLSDLWGPPVNLGSTVNSSNGDYFPSISVDGLTLFFGSDRPGGLGGMDLWVTTRATESAPWGAPVNLGPIVNSTYAERGPNISADGLTLFFSSERPGGSGGSDIWVTTRATESAPWGAPVNLGPIVNSTYRERGPDISADGRTLYFTSNPPSGIGSDDLWQAPIIPIVDFNGDGKVDIQDLLRLIESWGKDDPSVDIGPMPWGDGKVDEKDLEVLMSYWQQEILDPALAAYWKLDEIEGMGVADSAGGNNGYALGNPVWQPDGGQVDGALLLDGVDDFISAPAVLNPANGPFSVLAWVMGGLPGQVIISQTGGANWLMADAEGKLRTELQGSGRDRVALQSQTIITDGQWHRIGLVSDGSRRMLYVDGVVAAEDTQTLPSSGGGLYIGTGKNMEPGTFFSGLIDDVRIYNRAVRP